ncbi:XRE family transcriptional regulator [Paenibacillus dendritiformis]|uniref:helix-turn-helix domain-containing protein n=1 Tax=Paenibacillus dendritiformis TaxID=130049 RepID=UPI00105A5DC0|nr:helix-turn-helix transcriptional regulator [Paenibacillus dendritiformis]TDL57872.1 XRE family transcriptional regulator [Paenibacillus dendritiformis]
MSNFSNAIKHRLDDVDKKPSELAREIGYSPQYVIDLIKGKKRWNEQLMGKVCDALELEIKIVPKEETRLFENQKRRRAL